MTSSGSDPTHLTQPAGPPESGAPSVSRRPFPFRTLPMATIVGRWNRAPRSGPYQAPSWFESTIIVMIALASVLGAWLTFQAAASASEAASLDGQFVRELAEKERIETRHQSIVAFEEGLFATYSEHLRAYADFASRADALDCVPGETECDREVTDLGDPELAGELRMAGQGELAIARGLRPLFRADVPDWRDTDRKIIVDDPYDVEEAMLRLSADPRLGELRRSSVETDADAAQARVISLVRVVILLVAALLLLTLAYVIVGRSRRLFAAFGALAAVAAAAVGLFGA